MGRGRRTFDLGHTLGLEASLTKKICFAINQKRLGLTYWSYCLHCYEIIQFLPLMSTQETLPVSIISGNEGQIATSFEHKR